MDYAFIAGGLTLLIAGGEFLVRGGGTGGAASDDRPVGPDSQHRARCIDRRGAVA
jgi:hypothetical protein